MKMNVTSLIIAALFVAICGTAKARLDDNIEELRKRYGQGIEAETDPSDAKAGGTQTYKSRTAKYDVVAVLRNGRCVSIHYMSRDPNEALAPEIVDELMTENAGGNGWETDAEKSIITHVTSEGSRVAAARRADVGFFYASYWEKLFEAIMQAP